MDGDEYLILLWSVWRITERLLTHQLSLEGYINTSQDSKTHYAIRSRYWENKYQA